VETDGRLPSGHIVGDAIAEVGIDTFWDDPHLDDTTIG
jgi:hypothetical protein